MVGESSGSNRNEVRHLLSSIFVMKWIVSDADKSIRVVTRRASSSLSKGLKGLFCIFI